MEAISGQTSFDFEASELGGVRDFAPRKRPGNRMRESESWFQKALALEETGASLEAIVEAYQKVVELNQGAAGAQVTLGTIYYRQRKFPEPEQYYKDAITADPSYPL